MKSIYLRLFKEVDEPFLAQPQTPKLKTRDHRFSNGGLFAKSDPPLRASNEKSDPVLCVGTLKSVEVHFGSCFKVLKQKQ